MATRAKSTTIGRPTLVKGDKTVRVTSRLPLSMRGAIDDLADASGGEQDRSAVIRELLAEALAARRRRRKP